MFLLNLEKLLDKKKKKRYPIEVLKNIRVWGI